MKRERESLNKTITTGINCALVHNIVYIHAMNANGEATTSQCKNQMQMPNAVQCNLNASLNQ